MLNKAILFEAVARALHSAGTSLKLWHVHFIQARAQSNGDIKVGGERTGRVL